MAPGSWRGGGDGRDKEANCMIIIRPYQTWVSILSDGPLSDLIKPGLCFYLMGHLKGLPMLNCRGFLRFPPAPSRDGVVCGKKTSASKHLSHPAYKSRPGYRQHGGKVNNIVPLHILLTLNRDKARLKSNTVPPFF